MVAQLMAYEYIVHHDYRLVYKKVWGSYSTEDSIETHAHWDGLLQQGDIGKYDELQDLSEVTEYGISIEQIRRLARHYTQLSKAEEDEGVFISKKVAYVIPSPLAYGTGRVYEALIGNTSVNFRVFKDIGKACDWLGLSQDTRNAVLLSKKTLE